MEPICYYEYSDLTSLIRTYPKRCASHTQGGIPCEYYTVPRQHTENPAGYTGYVFRYDISNTGKLTRIGIRQPKYTDQNGNTQIEPIETYDGKYSPDILMRMHEDYINTDLTYKQFAAEYPFGHNATQDAYNALKDGLLYHPNYPSELDYLWFIQTSVRNQTLTFCFQCSECKPEVLFDILIDADDFDRFRAIMTQNDSVTNDLLICINSDIELYDFLREIFPTARFCYDMYGLAIAFDCLAKLEPDPAIKKDIRRNRNKLKEALTSFYKKETECSMTLSKDLPLKTLYGEIIDLEVEFESIELSDPADTYRNDFLNKLETFFDLNSYFFDDYFFTPCFHYPLPQEIITIYAKKVAKLGAFGIHRLAYIMLNIMSNIQDGKYMVEISDPVSSKSMFGMSYTRAFGSVRRIKMMPDLETLLSEFKKLK